MLHAREPLIATCALCRRLLDETGTCSTCAEQFPTVGGVSVLLPLASAWLGALKDQVRTSWAASARTAHESRAFGGDAERANAVADAVLQNQALFERIAQPALDARKALPASRSFPGQFVGERAPWSFANMLPYFYIDWALPRDRVRDLLAADAAQFAEPEGRALVLGAGAGGLACDLAYAYGPTTGVDSSIAPLLLADALAKGASVSCHLELAGWESATLHGTPNPPPVRWIAADAHRLPLADGAFDFVATQYLLDIVADPLAIAHEVNRVLKPGGVWAHLGLPFGLAGEPQAWGARNDFSPTRERAGFDALVVERLVHRHLDVRDLSPWSHCTEHSVVHAVSRKAREVKRLPWSSAFDGYFRGDRDPLAAMVPRLRSQGGIRVCRALRADAVERDLAIHVGGATFQVRDDRAERELVAFFDAIESGRSVADLIKGMARLDPPVRERDVALAVLFLINRGSLEVVAPASAP